MKNILLIALLLILMGCTTAPTNNVTVVNDTSLSQPTISPSGYIGTAPQEITLFFGEPVIVTSFSLNNETKPLTRLDEKTYQYNGSFPDGSYAISVSAEDAAGNAVSYSSSFTVDTTAPSVTVDPENNEQLASSDVTITLTFSEPVELASAKLGSTALTFTTTDNKTFTVSKNLNDGSYTLLISASDRAGNTVSSNTTFTVNIATPDHTAPPQITGLNATNTGNGGEIKLSWDESTVDDFKEYRIYKSSSEVTSVLGLVPTYTVLYRTSHVRTISDLTNNEKYCFAVTAVDNSNNELGDVVDACATPTEEDKTFPSITNYAPTTKVNDSTPNIMVETSEPALCKYAISTNNDLYYEYSNLTYTFGRNDNRTIHTKNNPALSNGTYNVYALCKDENGNIMPSVEQWEFEVVAYADTTAPVISSVSASTGETYATISWITSKASNSTVSYGWNTSLGTTVSNATMATNHSIKLMSLATNKSYYYNVTSCDAAGNCATEGLNSFVITEPPIANFSAWDGTQTGTNQWKEITIWENDYIYFDGYWMNLGPGSHDPDGFIAHMSWSFGDGGSLDGPPTDDQYTSPHHNYDTPGNYTVTLTVKDNLNETDSKSLVVHVLDNHIPSLSYCNVTPTSGDTTTNFTFYVTYTDEDGQQPEDLSLEIDSETTHDAVSFLQYEVDPNDNDVTDGKVYALNATFYAGDYSYYCGGYDGHDSSSISGDPLEFKVS